jgi:hypothetical protein
VKSHTRLQQKKERASLVHLLEICVAEAVANILQWQREE